MTAELYAVGSDEALAGGMGIGLILLLAAFYLAVIGLSIWVYVRIAQKAGYSGWWVLATFVPIFNIVVLVLFATKQWPVERRALDAEQRLRQALPVTGYGYGG